MSCKRYRLMAQAFHQAAIAGDHIGIMINEIVAEAGVQQALRQCHPDRRRDALPQRAGCRLDTCRMSVFRMPGGLGSPLPEGPELVERHSLISR